MCKCPPFKTLLTTVMYLSGYRLQEINKSRYQILSIQCCVVMILFLKSYSLKDSALFLNGFSTCLESA